MRTTVDIVDPILIRAKELAAKRQTTLKALIESALRDLLDAEQESAGPSKLKTHVFKGRGLQPGLSWDDWSTIREMSCGGAGERGR